MIDKDFGHKEPITGWGGFALMQVSDPKGRDWDGTVLRETVKRTKNTCGKVGENACTNKSGEGGPAGSSFIVGKSSDFLGMASLPAVKNSFYDVHAFARHQYSLLHALNNPKSNCEVECAQSYECGGKRVGPDFTIAYLMTADSVPRKEGGSYAVTRVELQKKQS